MSLNVLAVVAAAVLVIGAAAVIAATDVGAGLTASMSESRKLSGYYWHKVGSQMIVAKGGDDRTLLPHESWSSEMLPLQPSPDQLAAWTRARQAAEEKPSKGREQPPPQSTAAPAQPIPLDLGSLYPPGFRPAGFEVVALLQAQARARQAEAAATHAAAEATLAQGGGQMLWRHVPAKLRRQAPKK